MNYSTLAFLAFLAAVIFVYYIVPKRAQWVILLIASYCFYLFNGFKHVFFLLGTTLVTYIAALLMQKRRDRYEAELAANSGITRDEKQEMKKKMTKDVHRIQVISVLIDLGVLAVVKYLNFLISTLDSVLAKFSGISISTISIIVPLGISFYTFMAMGYLIDIGRGRYPAEKNFFKVALFLSFFPSITQGPINRFDAVGKQLSEEHTLSYENLKFGAQLIMWGFFKKLVIADRVAPFVSTVFSSKFDSYSGTALFVGMLAYAVQIYADFSGGIDISIGAAKMLGIELPANFERPYFSESLADYWRRWHKSLGDWMREYVFFPIMLSGFVSKLSKKARVKKGAQAAKLVSSVITTFTVFLLIGIWHGASFQYLAFGLYNATIVALSVALEPVFEKQNAKLKINTENFSWKLFRILRTFLITGISKILVRAPGLRAAGKILWKIITDFNANFLFGVDGEIYEMGIDRKNMIVLMISILVLFAVSLMQEKGIKLRETIAKQNIVFRWTLYLVALIVILVFGMYGPAYNAVDFIYKQY